nr:hypothetical protein [Elainella sp. Prado103]
MLALPSDDPNPEALNQDSYDDLLTAIESSAGQLALLIAVCDDPQQRQRIIQETDLSESHQSYRLNLATEPEPSLKAAIRSLLNTYADLQQIDRAVITVEGIEQLSFLTQGEEPSQQERFFGYLQWTREALREFHLPIVIWVTYQILSR